MASGTVFPTRHRGAPWARLFLALLLALGALAASFPARVSAANIAVTNTNDSGTGSLRQAILDAETTDGLDGILFVLPGSGPWTISLDSPLPTITKPLNIVGPGMNDLIIQGNNTFRLVTINAPGKEINISGLTLTKGKAVNSYGGNLRSVGGDLTLTTVALTNGTADDDQGGAGAFLSNGTYNLGWVLIKDNVANGSSTYGAGAGLHVAENHGSVSVSIGASSIVNNESTKHHGGGLMMSRTSGVAGRTLEVTLVNSYVSGNKSTASHGAGIYNDEGTLTLTNTEVFGNEGYLLGGGIHNNAGTVTLTASTISENTASLTSGGGIYNGKGTMSLNESTVSGNHAGNIGGGIFNDEGTLTLVGSTISGNRASSGGGLYNNVGAATLVNVTVSGNSVEHDGGGVRNYNGTLELIFATVTGNSASKGGGLFASSLNGAPTVTKVSRSIIVGNVGSPGADCATEDPIPAPLTSLGYNVVGTHTGCPADGAGDSTSVIPDAVLKAVLADNGGLTQTHALVLGSPAIDTTPCINTIDQRNVARPVNGNCDSGAFEYQSVASVAIVMPLSPSTVNRSPAGTGNGPFNYAPGTVVTLTAKPNAGKVHIGWEVDGVYQGWANPLTITMNADYAIKPLYVPATLFPDVPEGRADAAAIMALAARGTIRGYQNGNFGPDDGVTRAQMAALIARATPFGPHTPPVQLQAPSACLVANSWDCDDWGTFFADRDGVDDHLWRNIGTLAHYKVVNGYGAQACAAKGKADPCFGPNDAVSYAQTISFITRTMVAKGYWQPQPGTPNSYAGVPGAHAADVATFHYYVGSIPAAPADWNASATRGWFAQALWAALDSYWGADGLMPDNLPAGGYVN